MSTKRPRGCAGCFWRCRRTASLRVVTRTSDGVLAASRTSGRPSRRSDPIPPREQTGHAHSLDGLGKRGLAPTNKWYLRPMKLRLSDPSFIPDLRQHFERSGFVTNRLSDDTIEAWRPDAAGPGQERGEGETH